MSIYDWNIQESLNANSDIDVNWQIGQLAGFTNSSMRKMMQRFTEYLKDLSPQQSIELKPNGYNINFISKIKTLKPGLQCYMLAHRNSLDNDNFAINKLKSYPIYIYDAKSSSYRKILKNELLKDACYKISFYETIPNLKDEAGWIVMNFYIMNKEKILPIGTIVPYIDNKILPNNWAWCDGSVLNKTKYAELYKILKEIWGTDSSTDNFKLPDFRGVFLRGLDPKNKFKDFCELGVEQAECNKKHIHKVNVSTEGAHTHDFLETLRNNKNNISAVFPLYYRARPTDYIKNVPFSDSPAHTHKLTMIENTEDVAMRPSNYAISYIIKLKD